MFIRSLFLRKFVFGQVSGPEAEVACLEILRNYGIMSTSIEIKERHGYSWIS